MVRVDPCVVGPSVSVIRSLPAEPTDKLQGFQPHHCVHPLLLALFLHVDHPPVQVHVQCRSTMTKLYRLESSSKLFNFCYSL